MITGDIKNRIDKIWEIFWTGGLTNPITVIEQMNYLIFLKNLDVEQTRRENEQMKLKKMGEERGYTVGSMPKLIYTEKTNHLRWKRLAADDSETRYKLFRSENGVFDFLKNLNKDKESVFSKYMENAYFNIPTERVLERVMDEIDELYNTKEMENKDTKGDIYEYMLSKLSTSGTNGQFRTPKHIRELMVKLLKPTLEDKILDPACGTAGFLVSSLEYIRELTKNKAFNMEKFDKIFSGTDTDNTMLGIAAMNLLLHGVENPNLNRTDSLSDKYEEEEKYTMVLANPPFKGTVDEDHISKTLKSKVKTKKTELLFLILMLRVLEKGGRCAVIVPDGVLFGSSNAHKAVRKELIENNRLEAMISMPSGVFKPYAGVSTGILVFTKTGSSDTDKIWFYDMKADGYGLDDKRNEISENDIPDILGRWDNLDREEDRKRTEQSFFVSVDEIRENDYDLSINRYREIEYEEVEYRDPKEILMEIKELEKDIMQGIEELEGMLD